METLTIEVGDDVVTGVFEGDTAGAAVGILLAHGAGAGQDHPWMAAMRRLLAAEGQPTLTFNYPYTEAGRKSPDRPERLLPVHAAAARCLLERVDRVVLAGKSMGGRMGSHLVGDEEPVMPAGTWLAGLVYYGYPLVAVGKTEPRPVDHLHRIEAPQLFCAGTRDRLGPLDHIEPLVASLPGATLLVVDDGDHSFKVPKRSEKTNDQVLEEVALSTARWVQRTAT